MKLIDQMRADEQILLAAYKELLAKASQSAGELGDVDRAELRRLMALLNFDLGDLERNITDPNSAGKWRPIFEEFSNG